MSSKTIENSEQHPEVIGRVVFPYTDVESAEFRTFLARLHRSEAAFTNVSFRRLPGSPTEGQPVINAHLTHRWLLPKEGDLQENIRKSKTDEKISLAMAFHGFGCADIGKNYFEALAAALQIPVCSTDWAGLNCSSQDAKIFNKNTWMTSIDQNPYLLLQFLESQLQEIAPLLAELPNDTPLHLNLIGHSVGARSLLVAASLHEGRALKRVEELWQDQLRRPVKLQLTALEPAFGTPKDWKIGALRLVDFNVLHPFMRRTPHAALFVLRKYLESQAEAYQLVHSQLYPFSEILLRDRFPSLVAHPAAISQPPRTRILSIPELRQLGYSLVLTMAQLDRLVDNKKTQEIMGGGTGSVWREFSISVVGEQLTLDQYRAAPTEQGVIFLEKMGHIPEISHPIAIATAMMLGHGHQQAIN